MAVRPAELAATMRARAEEFARRLQQRRRQTWSAIESAARELLRSGEVRRVWVIGSLLHGGFGEGSDADVVVAGVRGGRLSAV